MYKSYKYLFVCDYKDIIIILLLNFIKYNKKKGHNIILKGIYREKITKINGMHNKNNINNVK